MQQRHKIIITVCLGFILFLSSCLTQTPRQVEIDFSPRAIHSYLDTSVSVDINVFRSSEKSKIRALSLSIEGLPSNYEASFEPQQLAVGQSTAKLTITIPAKTDLKTYNLQISATSGDIREAYTLQLYTEPRAYVENSKYAAVLSECALIRSSNSSCTLSKLPFIGQETTAVTKADVMNRAIVSHEWMGERFSQLLDTLPADMLPLFRPVTAIVISKDIRPAYYTSMTGAIYLDPAYLWTTVAEKRTIDTKKDYRSDYGKKLQHRSRWRYVLNNAYAYSYYSLTDESEREVKDIVYRFARLLYHELAHANDFLPPNYIARLNDSNTAFLALSFLRNARISTRLTAQSPLQSRTLSSMAQVYYQGETATAEQIAMTPQVLGADFERDRANHTYSYSTIREDLAMLFEATMMQLHYGIEMDVAFTNAPTGNSPACNDYVVGWGMRNKLAQPAVKARAKFVAQEILGTIHNWDDFFSNKVGTTTHMRTGEGWCKNLVLGTAADTQAIDMTIDMNPEDLYLPRHNEDGGWHY